ncbi:MAG: hypothetical protein MMC33_000066 [Icmadophila ericetorum]|nr:hypothetical protein [Icmadophila ericetorum]
MTRTRRLVSGSTTPSVTVARVPSQSPDSARKSIRLTVKMPSNKLREVTSGGRKSASVHSRDSFEPGEVVVGPRGSRAKRAIVDETGSEEDDEDEEEEEEQSEEDDEQEEQEDQEEEDDEQDAEGEDDLEDAEGESEEVDESGDVMMQDQPPPPPVIKMTGPASKPKLTVTPAHNGKLKPVEAKQMQLGSPEDEDEELSELDSDAEANNDEGGEEDAEGEEVDDEDQDMDQDEDDIDSDAETPVGGSRASTPDVSKMTKRQRSRLDQVMGSDFLQLPMEPQIKKHLTAEEHAMRRAEMARRRKNLSEKRNEEEKMDTINRLLKKQAPKRRGKISNAELNANKDGSANTPGNETNTAEPETEKPNPIFIRWVNNREGSKIGVPEEWLGAPVGRLFQVGKGFGSGRMVEEVEG